MGDRREARAYLSMHLKFIWMLYWLALSYFLEMEWHYIEGDELIALLAENLHVALLVK